MPVSNFGSTRAVKNLTRPEIVFAMDILVRQQIEIFQKDFAPLSLGIHQHDFGSQRHQCGRRGRRMHHGATVLIKNSVVLVLTAECKAALAAFADAIVLRRTEVPATRSLQQVAAERRHVADLRARRIARGVGQGRIALTE